MNFKKDVVKRSKSVPVVVDFWAPWCGPCKFLGPVIEELASEANGRWELVKVNSDENPEISREYEIRGIPAVKMFFNGTVIAEFTGALPKHQIEQWIDENIPDERTKALADILSEDEGTQIHKLREFVKLHSDMEEAKAALANRVVLSQPYEASKLVADFKPGNKYYPIAESVELINKLRNCQPVENNVLADKIREANTNLADNNVEGVIKALIEGVMVDKRYCDELPRKSVIAIFNILGSDHELTKKYRKKFDMALY